MENLESGASVLPDIFTLTESDSCLVDYDYFEKNYLNNKDYTLVNIDTGSPYKSDQQETVLLNYEGQTLVIPKSQHEKLLCILPCSDPPALANMKEGESSTTTKRMSLQEYRKKIGLQVHNRKSIEKIGVKPKSPPPDPLNIPCAPGKGCLCNYCGYVSSFVNKCQRCGRLILLGKTVDVAQTVKHNPEHTRAPQEIPKESFYGKNRRTRPPPAPRQTRPKYDEPQCVTLSSDEDDEVEPQGSPEPEPKKLKAEGNTSCLTPQVKRLSVKVAVKEPEENGDPEPEPDESKEEEKSETEDENESDLINWKDGGLNGTFFAVTCRSSRIGSYRAVPSDRVLFSMGGIVMMIPEMEPGGLPSTTSSARLVITKEQILKLDAHFGRSMPVIFINVSPSAAKTIRDKLHMDKSSGPCLDVTSEDVSRTRIVLLPEQLTDAAKGAIKQAFTPGLFCEINHQTANKILVESAPPDVRAMLDRLPQSTTATAEPVNSTNSVNSGSRVSAANKENNDTKPDAHNSSSHSEPSTRVTRAKSIAVRAAIPAVNMFSWADGSDRYSVNTDDYVCLNQEQLLNDSIIDFYLRYVFSTKIDGDVKSKCHVFSSFFYQRLTTRPPKGNGKKHAIEDDPRLSAAEKRHSRVKSWTKKVDLFEKDFLIVPINERSHWFLAIICFPGLTGPVTVKDNRPVKIASQSHAPPKKAQRLPLNKLVVGGQSFVIGSTTITVVGTVPTTVKTTPLTLTEPEADKDEAESDDDEDIAMETVEEEEAIPESAEPIKQPCILIFDSLAGSSRNRVMATLRDYLAIEYQVKKGEVPTVDGVKLFTKESMVGASLQVPQQNNYSDCGVYVLQYAESFMKKPFSDYRLPHPNMTNWFPLCMASQKRKDIQHLLIQLTKTMNADFESVLKLLPGDDVKVALSEKRGSMSPTAESEANDTNGSAIQEPVAAEEEEEEEPSVAEETTEEVKESCDPIAEANGEEEASSDTETVCMDMDITEPEAAASAAVGSPDPDEHHLVVSMSDGEEEDPLSPAINLRETSSIDPTDQSCLKDPLQASEDEST